MVEFSAPTDLTDPEERAWVFYRDASIAQGAPPTSLRKRDYIAGMRNFSSPLAAEYREYLITLSVSQKADLIDAYEEIRVLREALEKVRAAIDGVPK